MKKSQYESPHWYEDGKNTLPRDPDTEFSNLKFKITILRTFKEIKYLKFSIG